MGKRFSKKAFHGGTNFFGQIYGRVVHIGRLIIKSHQEGTKGILQMHFPVIWKMQIKPSPFYRIMEGLILEVNSPEVSKVVSCSVSHMLTLTWGICIDSRNRGLNFKNIFCTLCL